MSQERRPTPNQPPDETEPLERMAKVHHPPIVATSNSLARHDSFLPPIQPGTPLQARPNIDGLTLPPIQLQPPRQPPGQTSTHSFSIASILSSDPEPPRERGLQHASPSRYGFPSAQDERSFRLLHEIPYDGQAAVPTRPFVPPQDIAAPTMTLRTPVALYQSQPQPQSNWHYSAGSLEPEQFRHSPATSTHSFNRSIHSSSSEASPSGSSAPSFPTPTTQRSSQPPPFNYNLSIRQQPVAARACGFGERDRRVIDPPPILELKITDRVTAAPEQDHGAMLALHCTLLSQDGQDDETEVPPANDGMPSTRRLMGTLVASPYPAKDEHGVAGTFFVFPDLSCRSPGRYRLRFKLLRVDPTMMRPGAVHGTVASIVTEMFAVYTAKDFPGMRASSALLKSLRRQGLNVGVKKGSDARKGRGRAKKESSSDEDEESSEGDMSEERRASQGSDGADSATNLSPTTKRSKKGKKRRQET